jgi:GTPase
MTRCGHIALSGAPNVGKSSLLNRLVGTHLAIVSPKAQATRLPVVGLRTDGDTQFIWHDLPGLLDPSYLMQERMRELALAALPRMDVILQLHPAADAPAPPFRDLVGEEARFTAPVLVVYTKVDLVHPDRRRALAREALAVSTTSDDGIDQLLARVGSLLPEAPFEFDPDDVGTQPVRFFVVEYLREAAFELLGDELPYSFTAEVEEFREADEPVYIRASLFAERESQKGMIIGRSGSMIKQIGSHARARLEALLGQKVYLECRVKVLPRWRKNEAHLQRFGFPPTERKNR